MNRLAGQTSPYLLQHADNPVDWWPWSPAAFDEARRRDVPVLLSVGYAACHWCHVMAHESFEDPDTAAVMNDHFVNVKVDREERPDVDAVYMEATQALTGSGGWPMTCFLTHAGEPFYAGTYFPDRPRHGLPSFRQLLESIQSAWVSDRGRVELASGQVATALAGSVQTRLRTAPDPPASDAPASADSDASDDGARTTDPRPTPPSSEALDGAVRTLASEFDTEHAGFGTAPKFPPSMALEFLLRHAAAAGPSGREAETAQSMADATFRAMASGGMYDQLGGGFARYSVDRAWVVPHFEKMLYDNALLLRAYLHWHRLTGTALGARIARETAEFLLEELRTGEGGFAASLDADSAAPPAVTTSSDPATQAGTTASTGVTHGEGLYYLWTPAELSGFPGAADLFWVTEAGTAHDGKSVLQLRGSDAESAVGTDWFATLRAELLEIRRQRPRPDRDDKVVTGWNGMAIAALAEAGVMLDEPAYLTAALEAADLMMRVNTDASGRLIRTSRDGRAGPSAGVLEDYALLAEAYLTLLGATGDPAWLDRAGDLLDVVLDRFAGSGGDFYDTADDVADAGPLMKRPQDPTDGPTPSGQFAAAGALLGYAAVTGSARHRDAAEAALWVADRLAGVAPRAVGHGLVVAEAALAGPIQVAVVGEEGDPARGVLHRVAIDSPDPGAVVVAGPPSESAGRSANGASPPLLSGRGLVNGRAAAYVCRGFVCDRPITDPNELAGRIGSWRRNPD